MKTKSIKSHFIFSMLVAVVLLAGCSQDIDDKITATSITLEADKTELTADFTDKISFTVTDNLDNDITSKCKFYANSTQLGGGLFMTLDAGEYEIYAELDDLKSNSINVTATAVALQSIKLRPSKTEAYSDGIDSVQLSVFTNTSDDITNQATLYVNDVELKSNYYKTTEEGEVTFKATYEGFTSTATVLFKEKSTFKQRVLIEDYTGAWCGYCPRVAYAIEEATSKNPNVIALAIHYGDDMQYEHVASMMDKFNVESFPTAILNRVSLWDESYSSLASKTNDAAPLAIAMQTSLNGTKASVDVQVKTMSWFDNDLKIILCLTEDKLIYEQSNYLDDGKGNPIKNFEHNHVLRKAYTDIYGDELTGKNDDNIYEKSFDITINSQYKAENCKLVAIITNTNSNRVINAQEVKLGSSADF